VPANGEVGVELSTAAEDDTPTDDSPAHLPNKSRGKRRAKNKTKGRQATDEHQPLTDQPLNGHKNDGDWMRAVRDADIAAVRRLAASKAVDVNSTDEVSHCRKVAMPLTLYTKGR